MEVQLFDFFLTNYFILIFCCSTFVFYNFIASAAHGIYEFLTSILVNVKPLFFDFFPQFVLIFRTEAPYFPLEHFPKVFCWVKVRWLRRPFHKRLQTSPLAIWRSALDHCPAETSISRASLHQQMEALCFVIYLHSPGRTFCS